MSLSARRKRSCDTTSITTNSPAFTRSSKRRNGYPSETNVKRGDRVVHGDKELIEKLGRNDPCICGSERRFQEVLHAHRPLRRRRARLLLSANNFDDYAADFFRGRPPFLPFSRTAAAFAGEVADPPCRPIDAAERSGNASAINSGTDRSTSRSGHRRALPRPSTMRFASFFPSRTSRSPGMVVIGRITTTPLRSGSVSIDVLHETPEATRGSVAFSVSARRRAA